MYVKLYVYAGTPEEKLKPVDSYVLVFGHVSLGHITFFCKICRHGTLIPARPFSLIRKCANTTL